MGNKYQSKLKKKQQNTQGTYSKKAQEKHDTSALNKTKGIDELQGIKPENRGRKEKDAPRGKRKTSKKGSK